MTRLGFALSMSALVAAAVWTYHVNYQTKTALARIDGLRAEIAAEREAGEVLRVEWAYLNAPDRLASLVEQNNDQLRLGPMLPHNFDGFELIPFRRTLLDPEPPVLPPSANALPGVERADPPATHPADVPMPLPRPVAWRRP
jgi:hypothetical protein